MAKLIRKVTAFISRSSYSWLDLWLTVGVVLRCYRLDQPIWYDEAWSLILARLPMVDLLTATANDVHPPLYYLLINLVSRLGAGVVGLRMVSVLASLGAIWLVWMLTRNTPSGVQGLATALMALAPVQIYYAQELRSYALLQLLVLVSLFEIRRRKVIWVVIINTLILYTHNYGLFYVAALLLVYLAAEMFRPRIPGPGVDPKTRSKPLNAILAGGIPALLFAPWGLILVAQMGTVGAGFWIQPINLGGLTYAITQIVAGMGMPGYMMPLAVVASVAGLLVGAAYGLRHGMRDMVVILLVPIILVVLTSMIWGPILLFRGFIGILPAYYILVAGAVSGASTPAGRYIGQGSIGLMLVLTLGYGLAYNFGFVKANREVKPPSYIQATDTVVHLNEFTLLDWYAVGMPNQYQLDTACPHEPGGLTDAATAAIGIQRVTPDAIPADAYLVMALGPFSSACDELIANQLAQGRDLIYLRESDILREAIYH